jgi:hypothetical protein
VELRNLRKIHESSEKLENLGSKLLKYCRLYDGKFPESLSELDFSGEAEMLTWVVKNVVYEASGKTVYEPYIFPTAYDNALLEIANGTNVLFSDGIVKFCRPKQLQRFGINQ